MQTGSETKRQPPLPISADEVPPFHPRTRFLRSFSFFLGVVVQTYIWDIFLPRFAIFRWYVRKNAMQRWVKVARRFRLMAIEMGGMQIKLGQFLSSRADIIPDPVRFELAGLQDEVPPAPTSHVLQLIVQEYGKPANEVFYQFDEESVAAASLGQVHYATLKDGQEVAVKVQRPHIEEIIGVDLRSLKWIIKIIKNYPFIRRRADVEALYKEFSRVLLRELDYVQEAENAEVIRGNFVDVSGVYIPYPIKEMTTRRVLVMERISGIKISDRAALDAAGINRRELADRLNQTYLKQLFLDGFFHADPHPGNLFVQPNAPVTLVNGGAPVVETAAVAPEQTSLRAIQDTQHTPFTLIFVDFGMVSQLPPKTMDVVLSGILGLATNDANRIVDAMYDLKMFLPGVDKRAVTQMLKVMLKHTYDRSMQELNNMDVESLIEETHDMVYDMPFQVPQDLLFLGRAISMVAGLATEIDPNINLFQSLYPFAQKMLDREQKLDNWLERLPQELQQMGEILLNLPRQMDEFYKVANEGELHTQADFGRMERLLVRLEQSTNRLAGGVVATGLFMGGVQLRLRGMDKEANRVWAAAAVTLLWSQMPRNGRKNGL